MARSRYCRICKDFHDLEQSWPDACAGHFGHQAADAGFYIVSDNIDAFRSMADGKMYDSKSQYRSDLKARGLVELGNEQPKGPRNEMRPVRDDLRRSLQQLRG